MLKKLERLAPHAAILICNMYVVFFLIDRVNPAMNFIDNRLTKGLLLAMCALGLYNGYRLLLPWLRRRRMPAAPARTQSAAAPAPRAREGYGDAGYRRRGDYDRRDGDASEWVWDARAGEYRRRASTSSYREDTRR